MALLEAQTNFGLNLLRSIPTADTHSTIISPISISIALAMCYVGAKNDTARQISNAIANGRYQSINDIKDEMGITSDQIVDYFSGVMDELNRGNKSYELDSANKIYVQKKFQLLESYKDVLTKKFQGKFENIDFGDSEAAARVEIP